MQEPSGWWRPSQPRRPALIRAYRNTPMKTKLSSKTKSAKKARGKREASAANVPEQGAAFPVVGIGASAGGLEAFTDLLRHLPEKTGMAFVLVQHLDPTHGSVLPEILSRATKIPVTEVKDGTKVEPDHVYDIPAQKEESEAIGKGTDMERLLSLVCDATGVDFNLYKATTLQRRVKRRMVLQRLESVKDYLQYIKENPGELNELYRDILIHVTGFFRDKDAFDALGNNVFPTLFENRKLDDAPIRIWVPGCSSGEEVYSIAIVLLEYMWEKARTTPSPLSKGAQIFATDVSYTALDRARTGVYTEAAVAAVSPERLSRFFLRLDGGYRVNKSVRDMCIFARQNLVKDPPFSNLDLISCRNLLIYLGPALQKRVIPALHYALKPNGYLMLGESESLGMFADYFAPVDKKSKIFQKKKSATRLVSYFGAVDYGV